jgi:hypothetical protein
VTQPSHSDDRGILPDEEPIGTVLTRTCIGCGTDYEWTSREGFQWPTSYCTRKCKRKSSPKRRVRLDSAEDADEGMVLLICARCEEPFGWIPRAAATGHHRPPSYCSQTHADRAAEARRRARKKAAKETVAETQRQADERERQERIEALSAAARELLLPAARCETCGKVANPTKQAAKEAKRAIEARSGRTNEVRYYQCEDGWWHWTRMDASLDGWRRHRVEQLMTESPASLRHRGRGGWNHLGETR